MLGLRGAVLPGPAADLTFEVVTGATEVRESECAGIERVQRGQNPVHLVVDSGALAAIADFAELGVPEHAALQILHKVEHGADNALVLTQQVGIGHRHIGVFERAQHAVLPIHRMRRGQQFPRRLAAQHPLPCAVVEQKRGVGLSAGKFLSAKRAGKARQLVAQVALQGLGVQGLRVYRVVLWLFLWHSLAMLLFALNSFRVASYSKASVWSMLVFGGIWRFAARLSNGLRNSAASRLDGDAGHCRRDRIGFTIAAIQLNKE